MILNPTETAIAQALTPRKKYSSSSSSQLPGEPRPFTPMTQRTRDQLNLVPPQHLAPDGTITSSRSQEVVRADPLMLRIQELEAENASLRNQLEALK